MIAGLGLNWESKPPEKKKDGPAIRVDINLSGLPSGASAVIPSVDGPGIPISGPAPGSDVKGGGGKPAAGGGGGGGGSAPAPTVKTSGASGAVDIPVPDGLIPSGDSKKGK